MIEGNLHAGGHPGIQVVPLAWALTEQEGRPGRDRLAAFVVGYEVSASIKRASAMRVAVHPHGTFGTIGAAVALARLLGYGPAVTRAIINVSATLGVAASRRALTTGATVRNVYIGLSGAMGWLAHMLVQSGFTGEPDAVGSVYGAIYADGFDPAAAAARRLGEEFLLPGGFIKIHACGRYMHGALELRRDSDGPARAPAGVHPRHPRADLRHGGQPRSHGRPLGVRRPVLAALRRGVAPLSRPAASTTTRRAPWPIGGSKR
jgi:2-methylcitrate dehydratase PrpD